MKLLLAWVVATCAVVYVFMATIEPVDERFVGVSPDITDRLLVLAHQGQHKSGVNCALTLDAQASVREMAPYADVRLFWRAFSRHDGHQYGTISQRGVASVTALTEALSREWENAADAALMGIEKLCLEDEM